MGATEVKSTEISGVKRADIDITTASSALITKAIAGAGIAFSSTGVDAGTGDVTISTNITKNTQTASYPLVLTDAGKDVQMDVATANNLTIPLNSSVAYDVGTQIIITQVGVGQTTIVLTGGVTGNIPSGMTLRLRAQFSKVVLEKIGTNTWDIIGDLESAINIIKYLTSDATTNSTSTLASITGLEMTLDVGSYNITCWVRYQSAVATTGVKFAIDHSGTVTVFMSQFRYTSTGGSAATAAATMAAASATGNIHEGFTTRTKGTAMGPTVSVDATNSDMMAHVECFMIVTVSGTLKLMHASEVTASSTVKAGTNFIITKVN